MKMFDDEAGLDSLNFSEWNNVVGCEPEGR